METAEAKRDVCTIPEIVNGKANSPNRFSSAPKEFNFVASGELLVTITLAEYRHLISDVESKRQEYWTRVKAEDALTKAKDRIKALEAVMQKAGIAPGLYLKALGNERNEE